MSDDQILSDHRWNRTKLVPPMLDALGENRVFVQWKYELVPELIWIGELLRKTNPDKTVEIVHECAENAQKLFGNESYVLLRDFHSLSESEIEELRNNLDDKIIADLSNHLSTLVKVYPNFPFTGIMGTEDVDSPSEDDLQYISELIGDYQLRDHHSQ